MNLIVFVVLVGLGFAFLKGRTAIKKTKFLPWLSVRLGGPVILAAGWLSGKGWGGNITEWLDAALRAVGGVFGHPEAGHNAVWLAGLAFLVAWVGGMLPDFSWEFDPPDEFLWLGIPAAWFIHDAPGDAGELARGFVQFIGENVVHLVAGWF